MVNSKGYLLDTNIAIAILAKEDTALEFVYKVSEHKIPLYFSVITECEVFAGINSEQLLYGIKMFNPKRCIDVKSSTARLAGDIRRIQKAKGRRLKTPDAIIIATARENSLTLVSRDSDMNFIEKEYGMTLINLK